MTSSSARPLRRRVFAACDTNLALIGFKRRASGIYTKELAPNILGWLGLVVAGAPNRSSDDTLRLAPMCGLRQQQLEMVVAELIQEKPSSYIGATVVMNVGYFSQQNTWEEWELTEANIDEGAKGIVATVAETALPTLSSHATFNGILELLRIPGFAPDIKAAYRIPVALAMAGDLDAARTSLTDYLSRLGQRGSNLHPDHYRAFADRFLHRYFDERLQDSVS
jgi:hypothetical protein